MDENDFSTLLLDPIQRILDPLYDSYANQGPERAYFLPVIKSQDKFEAERYMRVVISRFIKPLGYLQILISKTPADPLHVSMWGEQVEELVRTEPNQISGELSRQHIIHPNDYMYA